MAIQFYGLRLLQCKGILMVGLDLLDQKEGMNEYSGML